LLEREGSPALSTANATRSAPRRGRIWTWIGRILVALVGLVLLLALAGVVYQFVATRRAFQRYPAPGEMVAVAGHAMQLHCTGEGKGGPTVVMDAGLGGGVLDWQTVQPEVAKFARVCTYDRSGIGWSESGPKPRTSRRIVEELHALLKDAGEDGPYVLVGHSFGGANAQLYAAEYPEEVAGMVLVDSALDTRALDKDLRDAIAETVPSPLLIKATAPLGIPRLLAGGGASAEGGPPEELAKERSALYNGTRHLYAVADESATINESIATATDAAPSLGDKPLIVLSAGARQYPGFTKEQTKRADKQANEFEAGLTDLSENSELVVAKDSTHYIQFDRPELVVDAIRRVVEAARDSGQV
jgi:pimeloyl-ACP methyl ester carboxylesterase